jgi:cellobiose-specific phosphotransferase system component IIB
MTNLSGFGMFNPPDLEQLHEAIALVEGGLNQLLRKQSRPEAGIGIRTPSYVDPERILQLHRIKSAQWDLRRLVRLLEEVNIAHANQAHMATAMLVRAVTDHVPPLFSARTFTEVANNYPAPRSFTEQMKQLDASLRKIADSHLHQHVRKTEVLPLAPQVDFRGAVDVLLSEVVRLLQ